MKIIKVVGGLGSQMMAYGLFVALKNKGYKNVIFDTSWFEKHEQHNGLELYNLFKIEKERQRPIISRFISSDFILFKIIRRLILNKFTIYAENYNYNYIPDVFNDNKLTIYDQSWTSYKYFEGIEENLIKIFNFDVSIGDINKGIIDKMDLTDSVSIHVRRGDYLKSEALGGVVGIGYYKEAIDNILSKIDNPNFFVFSDDINWCKDNLNLKEKNVDYISWNTGESSYLDLYLMTKCKNNIIANSSFSWWGAYLNKNKHKIVICPKQWGNKSNGVDLDHMNLPSWIELDNNKR